MGEREDEQYRQMSEAPVAPLIVRLAIPTTIATLVTSLYNLVDTAFVGHLGTSASGAMGIVFGVMAIIQAFGFMYGQGAGSIISRLLGKRMVSEACTVGSTGVVLAFTTGVLIALVGNAFVDPLVTAMGATPTIAPYARDYTRFILGSAPAMVAELAMNQILRYEGKATLGMAAMLVGCVLNVGLEALCIFGLGLGIAGSGLGTAVAETVSFLIMLALFHAGRTATRLSLRSVSLRPSLVLEIVTTGFPSLIRQGLNSVNSVLLNNAAAPFGDAAVAAMSIVGRIVFFAFSFVLGVGQGFQPVVGFNYGAERYDRVRASTKATIAISEALIAVLSAIIVLFPEQLVRLFGTDAEVVAIGAEALRLQGLALVLLPISIVCEMLYQACGRKLGASIITCLRNGILFAPLIVVLPRVFGLFGVEAAQAITYAATAVPALGFLAYFFAHLPREATSQTGPAPTS